MLVLVGKANSCVGEDKTAPAFYGRTRSMVLVLVEVRAILYCSEIVPLAFNRKRNESFPFFFGAVVIVRFTE